MDYSETTISRQDVQLHVLDTAGAGAPVLILHGLAGSSREFMPTAEALYPDFRTILIDQRGHGRSTRRPSDTSRTAFVDDVAAVIEHLTPDVPVVLVGQSMGAHSAVLAADVRPDLVAGLVMLEGIVEASADSHEAARLGAYFASWPLPFSDPVAARAFLGDGPLAAAWINDLVQGRDGLRPRFDADIMESSIRAVHARSRWAEWERLKVPTVAVFADNGMFTEQQKAELIRRRPSTRRVDLPDAGHDAHLDAFNEWIRALRGSLAEPG